MSYRLLLCHDFTRSYTWYDTRGVSAKSTEMTGFRQSKGAFAVFLNATFFKKKKKLAVFVQKYFFMLVKNYVAV